MCVSAFVCLFVWTGIFERWSVWSQQTLHHQGPSLTVRLFRLDFQCQRFFLSKGLQRKTAPSGVFHIAAVFSPVGTKVSHLTLLLYPPPPSRRPDARERDGEIVHGEEQPAV